MNKKISIIIRYYNNKAQLILCLNSISLSKYDNFDIIIVNDGSSSGVEDIIYKYSFPIKLINIETKDKKWINQCICFNIGINNSNSDIVVLQSAEICHVGDILTFINDNLKNDDYYIFNCFALPDLIHNIKLNKIINNENDIVNNIYKLINDINYNNYIFDCNFYLKKYPDLKEIKTYEEAYKHWITKGIYEKRSCNKFNTYVTENYIANHGWYVHHQYQPKPFNYLSACHRNKIIDINGLDGNGNYYSYYDNDFFSKIKTITNIRIVPENNLFSIFQYNPELIDFNTKIKFEKNINMNSITKNSKYTIFNNLNINNIKIGIAITTYSDDKTNDNRYQIIEDSFHSLLNTKDKVIVIIIVDGSYTTKHKLILEKYQNAFEIIYRNVNGGIAKAKNTCIKALLDRNIDIGFLADDDIIYRKGWYRIYASNMISTNIPHFIYWPLNISKKVKKVKFNETALLEIEGGTSGCFITFTKNLIEKNGYFRIFPEKYGFEHIDFTYRCLNNNLISKKYDVYGSDKYLELHKNSFLYKSCHHDKEKIVANKLIYLDNITKASYVPFCD